MKMKLLLITSTLVFLLSGCSPYIKPIDNPAISNQNLKENFYGSLPKVILDANQTRLDIFKEVTEAARVKSFISNSLLFLTPTALYLTLESSANAGTVGALGLAGATLFGYGRFNYSEPRVKLYLAASDAISCAIMRESPYLIRNDDKDSIPAFLQLIDSKNGELIKYISDIKEYLGENESKVKSSNGKSLLKDIKSEIRKAENYLSSLSELRVASNSLLVELDLASFRLLIAVNKIITTVNKGIFDTEPDLQSILAYSQQVQPIANLVAQNVNDPAPAFIESPDKGTLEEKADVDQGEKNALEQLKKLRKALLEKVKIARLSEGKVKAIIAETNNKILAVNAIGDCELDPVDKGFRVIPELTQIKLEAGDKEFFTIIDKNGIPSIQLSGLNNLVTLNTVVSGGGIAVTLVVNDEIERSDEGQLVIFDSTGDDIKQIQVNVIKPKKCTELTEAQVSFLDESEKSFVTCQEDAQKVQKEIGAKVDTKFGDDNTRRLLEEYVDKNTDQLGNTLKYNEVTRGGKRRVLFTKALYEYLVNL